ncbi:MAG: hypothetical protein JWP16_779 [Alphaproteobacteria bacterium]|nr:hypothetical protein [Alphaproteobacteria bacterium]MDB5739739.1 hypothetical protein [Alphaproteobacteria bacterium]
MPRLLVTPLSSLSEALAVHGPSHLVSLLSPEHMIATPDGFPAARHLKLGVNDIVDPAAGTAPPARAHIDQLLEFSRGWDMSRPMVIHCWAGISRSMASAFAILCDRLGENREIEIARAIRQRAPHAQPNRLLVQHADDALGRGGRMIGALNSMGPALLVEEGVTTTFPLVNL